MRVVSLECEIGVHDIFCTAVKVRDLDIFAILIDLIECADFDDLQGTIDYNIDCSVEKSKILFQ